MQTGISPHSAGNAVPPRVVQFGERGGEFASGSFRHQHAHELGVSADFLDVEPRSGPGILPVRTEGILPVFRYWSRHWTGKMPVPLARQQILQIIQRQTLRELFLAEHIVCE